MTVIINGTDNSASAPAFTGGTGGTGTGVFYPASNQVALATNGTTAVTIDASQNVSAVGSLGTTITSKTAQFNAAGGSIYTSYADGTKTWRTGAGIISAGVYSVYNVTDAGNPLNITAASDLLFRCASAPSASVGGFGIGNFAVMGSDTAFVCSSGAYTGGDYQIGFVNGNGLIGNIFTSNSSTSYNTSSDYRLKENIAPMQNALNVVQQLKPVTYSWKSDGSSSQGFIAHELQKVMPDCVTGEKDAVDAEGKPVYQGIDTSFLVATLTAAIQEQQALITTLTDRITALEAK